jgi:GNAT superfamily N-acetyltransferase
MAGKSAASMPVFRVERHEPGVAVSMIIRRAKPTDLEGICAVAESVRLDPHHVQEHGFLVYVHDRQGYAERMAATDLFYVAIEGGEVVGFVLGYEDHTVADLVRRRVVSNDVLHAQSVAGCDGRWIYADQLAEHPAYAGRGVGIALVKKLYEEVRDRAFNSVFVAILHDPPNTRSTAFCEGLGFAFRGTLRYEDGRQWGLYARSIPAKRTGESVSAPEKVDAVLIAAAESANPSE